MSLNGANLHASQTIWIEETDIKPKAHEIMASKRIGVDYAEECAEWEWRFEVGREQGAVFQRAGSSGQWAVGN